MRDTTTSMDSVTGEKLIYSTVLLLYMLMFLFVTVSVTFPFLFVSLLSSTSNFFGEVIP